MTAGDDAGQPKNVASAKPTKKTATRQPISSSRSFSGIQRSRTPEYLVIGHICADIQQDGSVVLGGTALQTEKRCYGRAIRIGERRGKKDPRRSKTGAPLSDHSTTRQLSNSVGIRARAEPTVRTFDQFTYVRQWKPGDLQ